MDAPPEEDTERIAKLREQRRADRERRRRAHQQAQAAASDERQAQADESQEAPAQAVQRDEEPVARAVAELASAPEARVLLGCSLLCIAGRGHLPPTSPRDAGDPVPRSEPNP